MKLKDIEKLLGRYAQAEIAFAVLDGDDVIIKPYTQRFEGFSIEECSKWRGVDRDLEVMRISTRNHIVVFLLKGE